ncbi:chromosome transmission fidelity protein 18 [Cryptococcus neoformans Bt1]|nr:chromosome transmission fidelity protein 18 [Cryptococcus neoformans var. grubii Bt1]OXG10535.1 chromosome transmission fidelity protein 18 [Cryptococcus neoformans var. grubii Ze90-1]
MPEASSETLVFEPTDIFDFEFGLQPQPQSPRHDEDAPPTSSASAVFTNNDVSNSTAALHLEGEGLPRPIAPRMPTPPPDFEPDENWEDEMAVMEMEREFAELQDGPSGRDDENDEQAQLTISGKEKDKETAGDEFFSTGIFDFDAPVASSSRVTLTPPLDIPSIPLRQLPKENEPQSGLVKPTRPCTLPSLMAATADGEMVTFQRRWKPQAISPLELQQRGGKGNAGQLLSVPLHKLLDQVNELKSREKALKLQRQIDEELKGQANKIQMETTMWVDKYRPKKFTDLLGEDRVHREVMSWLKEWDKCVFKRQQPQAKKRPFDASDSKPFAEDPLGRPHERVLLLSGPPGYGKTTLASVVARHAGYRILEINASDDRSYQTVQSRIRNAIDAGTSLGAEGKPTCVVIDEVDGAGGGENGFIKALIKLIQDVPARKKSNVPAKPLRRPIICICNDVYAPALRPLRSHARIIRFRKPQAQSLVVRLRDICKREGLQSDTRSLNTLVEMTSGDVRSCLNTLQFIKSRSVVVTEEAIRATSLGLKDTSTTLQTAWNALFIPLAAKKRRAQGSIDDTRYLSRIISIINSCGEYDKLLLGAFEHYPNLKPLDGTMKNLTKVHEWLAFSDRLQARVTSEQEWELLGYMPWGVGAWYPHLASQANSSKPTEYPKIDYEAYQTRVSNEEVATAFKNVLPPILRSMFTTSTTLTELIPFLMRIISPPLKPVNANIVKPAENAVLERLVELMIPLGLTFYKEKAENGQPMMRLEPAIDVFVHYDGKRAEDILASRFMIRQLISQAMDAQLARKRGEAGTEAVDTGVDGFAKAYGLTGNVAKKPEEKALLPVTDFFGRTVAVIEEEVTADGARPQAPSKKKFRPIYKFNEGSLSAVRRSVKMSALM